MSGKRKEIDKKKLSELYELYKGKRITRSEMASKLGVCKVTLDKRIKEYVETNEQFKMDITSNEVNSEFQIFNNEEFGSIRVLNINDEPWFVGKDIAELLGYKNSRKAISDRVDSEDKKDGVTIRDSMQRNQKAIIINESGLYSLILSSKLPSAKKFKHWITSEVLPSIRKHGTYMTPETLEQALYNPDFLIKLATNLKVEQEKNIKLKEENNQLSTVNAVLIKETNDWDSRSLITHLIRKYGYRVYQNRFSLAWNEFYKNLNYKLHINLNQRLSLQENKKKTALDMIKSDEWSSILKIAVAMCEAAGINTVEIIKKHHATL